MPLRPLTAIEARVLGTLMEKARTVPDSYPLSLNALLLGCNQKTSRDPLMNLDEAQVLQALQGLKAQSLVFEVSGARVLRWEHNLQRALGIAEPAAVLMGLLMLRGPQTPGELRINGDRWYRFADLSSVEAFLEELAARSEERGGPLVVRLPRAPGARESRWAHLLCGPVDAAAIAPAAAAPKAIATEPAALSARIEALESEVIRLRADLQTLAVALGMSLPGHPESNDRA